MLKLEVTGLEGIEREMKRALARYETAARVGLYETAVELAAEAERRTPVSTGELQESMYVTAPVGSEPAVELGYGSEHAVPVHERTDVNHQRGESKFLQRAVDAYSARVLELLRARISAAVDSGAKAVFTSRFPVTPQVNEKTQRRVAGIERRRAKRQMFRLRKK